jgi:hypothetical protein
MRRVLFRYTAYGIMCSLMLDALWLLIDGRQFPGGIALNKVVNALFLASGIVIGCLWYLSVLETLGYRVTRKIGLLVMSPGIVFTVLNLISIKTGWIFYVTEENVYVRGPLFWLQTAAALAVLFSSFLHCLVRLLNGKKTVHGHAGYLDLRRRVHYPYVYRLTGQGNRPRYAHRPEQPKNAARRL